MEDSIPDDVGTRGERARAWEVVFDELRWTVNRRNTGQPPTDIIKIPEHRKDRNVQGTSVTPSADYIHMSQGECVSYFQLTEIFFNCRILNPKI